METAPLQLDRTDLPDKLYFRMGEVSQITALAPHVIRFWEQEFPALSPVQKGRSHRLYRRRDVELLLEIKRLLYEQRFTIEGARKFLESHHTPARATRKQVIQKTLFVDAGPALDDIRRELRAILDILR